MDLGIAGRKALVVGAGKGLGRAIALSLAKEKTKVIAVSRTASDLESLLGEMGGTASGHQVLAMDMMPEAAPQELIQKLKNQEIDIVVHNLGASMGIKSMFPAMDDFHKVMRINLNIAVELNNYFIPEMQKRKWGRVVHVSSASAVVTRGSLCYTVAKAALNTYTESLGLQVARSGVNVSSVMPGAIAYPGSHWDKLYKEKTVDISKYLDEHVMINRFAKPEEVAAAITFMCSESAVLFSGSQLRMDGGTH